MNKNNIIFLLPKKILSYLKNFYNFILRNRSFIPATNKSKEFKNIFIIDTRTQSILFDSFMLLVRASNFFYKDKWTVIIYEDKYLRYNQKNVKKDVYYNNLINIFLQSLLILPNAPYSIKFINNSFELLKIIKKSKKIFPENYNFYFNQKFYLTKNFNDKDFQNFKENIPILKSSNFHSEIFKNYLKFRNIKNYITITIRSKSLGHQEWNTDLEDIKIFLNFVKKNNLIKHDILILPDTQQDVPKEIMEIIKNENLKYHFFHHGSFSIPMRFLAYSNASFNLASTNGPATMLLFIDNNSFFLIKDEKQSKDVQNFVNKFNEKIFLGRKFIFHKKNK